jgi:hypothetical protein
MGLFYGDLSTPDKGIGSYYLRDKESYGILMNSRLHAI